MIIALLALNALLSASLLAERFLAGPQSVYFAYRPTVEVASSKREPVYVEIEQEKPISVHVADPSPAPPVPGLTFPLTRRP